MGNVTFAQAFPYAHRAAQVRCRTALRGRETCRADAEDIQQEAILAVLLNLRQFDPARASLRTFVERVVANRIATVMRSIRRESKRRFQQLPDGPALDSEPITLRGDVSCVLDGVSNFDRRVATSLMCRSPSETSRLLGTSRATVYRSIDRLREALTAAGFANGRGALS